MHDHSFYKHLQGILFDQVHRKQLFLEGQIVKYKPACKRLMQEEAQKTNEKVLRATRDKNII